jgi:tRNA(Ile)-lysidine synthase
VREKVLRYIREQRLMRAGDRVCVTVSGGADSVALLRILLELRAELGIVLLVAHFNHGLRVEESDADEAFVADLARHYGLEFFADRSDVRGYASSSKQSIEAAGRQLRYQWFARLADEQKFDLVATAHTLDDQGETVLLKFLRGAGTRGLAGIYPKMVTGEERHARIVRPLLEVTRDEVEQYLTSVNQTWREDESNLDHHFARNRVRHELLPLLECEYNPNLKQRLSELAELSRAEEEYWQAIVAQELEKHRRHQPNTEGPLGLKPPGSGAACDGTAEAVPLQSGGALPSAEADSFSSTNALDAGLKARSTRTSLFHERSEVDSLQSNAGGRCLSLGNFRALPLALQRRLLRQFAEIADVTLDFAHVEKLLDCALGKQTRAELPRGWLASCTSDLLELHPPQPTVSRVEYQYTLPIPGELRLAELGLTVRSISVPQAFAREAGPQDSLLCGQLLGPELVVRNWRPGDRFHPAHSGSEEKLKRLFSERHIPLERRRIWPLALCGSQIVWVRGFPVAAAFAWNGTGDAVKIETIG